MIGAALLDADAANIAASLPLGAWYSPPHAHIASAIADLIEVGEPVEEHTVHARLLRVGLSEVSGGPATLIDAISACGAPSSARFYASSLRELHERRELMSLAGEAVLEARDGSLTVAIGYLEEGLERLNGGGSDKPVMLGDVLGDHIDLIERRHAGEVVTIPTGLVDLDALLGGLRPGELTIAAGRPGMGKTIYGGCVAVNVATAGTNVLFASLEMSTTELLDRWIGGAGRLDTTSVQRGDLDERGWTRVASAVAKLSDLPLWILDRPEASVPLIRSAARSVKAGLVVVDYLGLIKPIGRHSNRQEEVASIARSLKAMARVLDCPVLALAQLNRAVEMRSEKKPLLSDLRESGEIEQSAGVVLGLYRDDYYDPDSADHGLIEISVLKNRHGPLGFVKAAFLAQTQTITNAVTWRTP